MLCLCVLSKNLLLSKKIKGNFTHTSGWEMLQGLGLIKHSCLFHVLSPFQEVRIFYTTHKKRDEDTNKHRKNWTVNVYSIKSLMFLLVKERFEASWIQGERKWAPPHLKGLGTVFSGTSSQCGVSVSMRKASPASDDYRPCPNHRATSQAMLRNMVSTFIMVSHLILEIPCCTLFSCKRKHHINRHFDTHRYATDTSVMKEF